jgi:single-strand DNA-binding protein|tara:strand:+ start:450 stop:854 length:405 start_codon:yes stop_codon:yes gene_type:complete
MSLNKVMLIGNVGVDPEYRTTATGTAVVSLTLATNEKWTDKQGAKQEKTEWHRVAMFNKLAELANQYVKKGSKIYIEGKITTSTYEKNGEKRYSTEIIANSMQFLDSKPKDSEPRQQAQSNSQFGDDFNDDIPF